MSRIAVVGSGISGLGAAWLLRRHHQVTLIEAEGRLGGHSNTVTVEAGSRRIPVDTGFIVYNDANYPNLVALFEALGVATAPSDMSFAFSGDDGGFEYGGSLGGLFAQRRNLLRPRTWRLIRDLRRFYREAPAFLASPDPALSLGDYLERGGYGERFRDDHLLPMAAAIWSSPLSDMLRFPAASFLRFFDNHGLLRLSGRPRWRTVSGGSRAYVARIAADLPDVRLGDPVVDVGRRPGGVEVAFAGGSREIFDQVVLACHGDQALRLLGAEADPQERAVLGAFRYQRNRAVLHSDPALMPRNRRVWSSWNYLSGRSVRKARGEEAERAVSVTYWMNRLQTLDPAVPLFVSLNPLRPPAADKVHATFDYDHPLFDAATAQAQRLLPAIQGRDRIWYCGSYCGYGFHEDGLQAAVAVAASLGCPAPWAARTQPVSPAAINAAPLTAPGGLLAGMPRQEVTVAVAAE